MPKELTTIKEFALNYFQEQDDSLFALISPAQWMAMAEAYARHRMQEKFTFASSQTREYIKSVRAAFADYVRSQGCGCCRDDEANNEATEKLGALLNVDKYTDGSGYDFRKYSTKNKKK